jgi:hypothetical protein
MPPLSQLKKLKQWLGLAGAGYGLTWTRPLKLSQDLNEFFTILRQIGDGEKEKEPLTVLGTLQWMPPTPSIVLRSGKKPWTDLPESPRYL